MEDIHNNVVSLIYKNGYNGYGLNSFEGHLLCEGSDWAVYERSESQKIVFYIKSKEALIDLKNIYELAFYLDVQDYEDVLDTHEKEHMNAF